MKRRDFVKGAALTAAGAGALALSACGDKEVTKVVKDEATTDTTTDIITDTPAAPAIVKGKRELNLVTTWEKDFPGIGTGAQRLADSITAMSDGYLKVKLHASGELVPAADTFASVSEGRADMYHSAEYYWGKTHSAFNFFTSVPFGLTANEMNAWLYYGGGQELWDELSAGYNIKCFAAGNTGGQMGGWFKKKINTINDYKGLKIRMPGLGGEILKRIGARALFLPGPEIYPSLRSGAIDATEWIGPWNDLDYEFYKVTKYYYYPGFHEPGSTLSCGLNKDVWGDLTADHQAIIAAACGAENNRMLSEYTAKNATALHTLVHKHKVNVRRQPKVVLSAIAKAADEVVANAGASDDLAKRVYKSYMKFRKDVSGWTSVSETAFAAARKLDKQLGR